MTPPSPSTRVLGVGHVGRRLLETLGADGRPSRGTVRSPGKAELLRGAGLFVSPLDLDRDPGAVSLSALLDPGESLVITLPPDPSGQRAELIGEAIRRRLPGRVVLLSTTGVYAETAGGFVDEDSPVAESSRARERLLLEDALERSCQAADVPLFTFRLPGIYGRGRGLHRSLQAGRIRLWGGGKQVVNRVHVDDIVAAILLALEAAPEKAGLFNLGDDHPAPFREVVSWLCEQLALPLPEEAPLEDAPRTLQGSKIVKTEKVREILGWRPTYSDYRSGFAGELGDPAD